MKLRRGVLVSLLLVGSSLLTLAATQAPASNGTEAKSVGSEACKDCHEDRWKEFQAARTDARIATAARFRAAFTATMDDFNSVGHVWILQRK